MKEAEKHFRAADQAPPDSTLSLVAAGIRRDLDCITEIAERRLEDIIVQPEFFGPLWSSGAPSGWPGE